MCTFRAHTTARAPRSRAVPVLSGSAGANATVSANSATMTNTWAATVTITVRVKGVRAGRRIESATTTVSVAIKRLRFRKTSLSNYVCRTKRCGIICIILIGVKMLTSQTLKDLKSWIIMVS